jgi:hypothetical protein
MTRRKFIPTNKKKARFTPDDIVRAIEAIGATGLEVLSVEITQSGAIKIGTGPRRKKVADAPPSKTE